MRFKIRDWRIAIFFLSALIILPQLALAANPCSAGSPDAGIAKCVNQVYKWSLAAAALLALLMMVLGGYTVMTAGGNAQQSTKGKDMIMSSAVGLGLLFAAYIILNTINPDLVNFKEINPQSYQNSAGGIRK